MPIRPRRRSAYLPSALLVSLEANLFLGAPLLAAALHTQTLHVASVEMSAGVILPLAAVYAVVSLVSMFALGLYTSRRSSLPSLVLRIGVALAMATFVSTQLYKFMPGLADGGELLAAATTVAFLVSGAIRITFDCVLDHEVPPRVILVLGAGRRAAEIARMRRRRSDRQWFTVLGYVVTAGDRIDGVTAGLRVAVGEDLRAYCKQRGVEEIVVAMDDHRYGFPLAQVNECRDAGIVITGLGAFLERETGGIRLDALEPSGPANPQRSRQEAPTDVDGTQMTQPLL